MSAASRYEAPKSREALAEIIDGLTASSRANACQIALILALPAHQARHSLAGIAMSKALGIKPPPNMYDLDAKARELGLDPAALWPQVKINFGH